MTSKLLYGSGTTIVQKDRFNSMRADEIIGDKQSLFSDGKIEEKRAIISDGKMDIQNRTQQEILIILDEYVELLNKNGNIMRDIIMLPDGNIIFINPKLREQWNICSEYSMRHEFKPTRFTIKTISRRDIEDGTESEYYLITDTFNNNESIEYFSSSIQIPQLIGYIKTLELMYRFCNIHNPTN